jgi:hypothetical protein
MRENARVYRTNRFLTALSAIIFGAVSAWFVSPDVLAAMRVAHFHKKGSLLNLLPPDGRVLVCFAFAALLLLGVCAALKFTFNPRVVTIDDEGIEISRVAYTERGEWSDFVGLQEVRMRRGVKTMLTFRRLLVGRRRLARQTIALPYFFFRFNDKAIIQDIQSRIAKSKGFPDEAGQAAPLSSRPPNQS